MKIELSENPDHPFVLFNLGMTYGDMDCHIEAIEHLEKCIQISSAGESHVRKAYALLVSSLTELNRCDDAWARLTQAIADFPNDPELQFRKGLVAHRLNRLAEAANAYRNAIANRDERHFSSIDRSLTGYKARQNLAIVLEEQGKLDLAEIQWRRVLDELPSYRPPWRGLSECLLKQKKLKTLQVELEQIPNERPLLCESAIQRYLIAKASGDLAEASRQLGQAAHILPDDIHLLRCRCHFLFDNGNPDEAIQALSELCRREPNDGAAHHNLGLACLRANRTGAAKVAFENSLAVRPNHSLTQQLLASLPAG
ncbi:MAG TPA: tetratricopeptide repeat protein [Pirellulales bacterium]